MSASHPDEASPMSPNGLLINNNDASNVNQNLKQEASSPKSLKEDPIGNIRMQIFVLNIEGRTVTLDVDPGETIKMVKDKLEVQINQ